jgi:Bifunctional DNA primase/polymerase, N-terminal/Primase C terminal 1 (PriCT-1)
MPQAAHEGDFEHELSEMAVWYATQGIPVFPCKARTKKPHTRHGFKDATANLVCIRHWWGKWPDANIAIPTGEVSGLMALDIDPRNHGDDSLDAMRAKHGALPNTAEQTTGGGGRHIVFRDSVNSRSMVLAPGIELKGHGTYIIVAPSIHPSGERYEWDGIEGRGALLNPAAAPAWLLERITATAGASKFQTRNDGETWGRGERNNRLASLAGAVRRCGLCPAAMRAALLEENRQRCDPPLTEKEVQKIASSISRYQVNALRLGCEPGVFVPPGYNSPLEAILDVLRFTADLPQFLVLLFHVERSLGYGKRADRTALSQITDGVVSHKLNAWVRKGCGLKKAAVTRANKALAGPELQLLHVRRRNSAKNGNEPTEYEVNWEGLSQYIALRKAEAIPPCIAKRQAPLVSQRDTHNHYQGAEQASLRAERVGGPMKREDL